MRPNDGKRRRRRNAPPGEIERVTARRVRALELRTEGKGFREIAATLGVSLPVAYEDVNLALGELEELKKEKAERVLELDLARIDGIIEGHYPAARSGDEKSAMVVLRALERRAKLLAMDAQEKPDPELDLLKAYLLHRYGFGAEGNGVDRESGEPTRH